MPPAKIENPDILYSHEAEGAILGAMIVGGPEIIQAIRSTISVDDFFYPAHKLIYQAIADVHEDKGEADLVLIRDQLKITNHLADAGGVEYLARIADCVPSAESYPHYAAILKDYTAMRAQLNALNDAYQILTSPIPIRDRLAQSSEFITKIEAYKGNGYDKIEVQTMDTIEPKDIQWLWPNRIPCGMVSLLVGLPGQGKSFVSLDMAARLSHGLLWPDGTLCSKAETIIFAFEEDLAVATRPRLDAMGADCTKIHAHIATHVQGVKYDLIDVHKDLPLMEKLCNAHPEVKLIIFDPITSALGSTDQNNQAEVRDALTLLANFAAKAGVAILGISHFAKRTDTAAVYKTLGSVSFAAVARSVWCVHRDPISEENIHPPRLFLPVKANYSIEAQGLSFDIINGAVQWSNDVVTQSVDEVMKKDKPKRDTADQAAIEFLKKALKDGQERKCTDLDSEAQNRGISHKLLWSASQKLGIKRRKSPIDRCWYWFLKLKEEPNDADHTNR